MKKTIVIFILVLIVLMTCMKVYAWETIETQMINTYNLPYYFKVEYKPSFNDVFPQTKVIYSSVPVIIDSTIFDTNGIYGIYMPSAVQWERYEAVTSTAYPNGYMNYHNNGNSTFTVGEWYKYYPNEAYNDGYMVIDHWESNYILYDQDGEIVYNPANISMHSIINNTTYDDFVGLSFDWSGFLGDANISLGKKTSGTNYSTIQSWTYPTNGNTSGTITIPASQIIYGNNGDYIVTISDDDTVVNTYYYSIIIPDETVHEIVAPADNDSVSYYPNIQLRLQNNNPVNVMVNGQVVKRIASTAGKLMTDIIAYESGGSLLQLGLNLIEIVDDDGNILDSNEFTVLRENIIDTGGEDLPSRLEWSTVGQTIQEFKETYSEFINTVGTVFSFLPSPWIALGTFGIGISLIMWFIRLRSG